MSSRNTGLEYNNKSFVSAHVGGRTIKDNNITYNNQQYEIINNNQNKVPQQYEPRYEDMYTNYSGLLGGQIANRNTSSNTTNKSSKNERNDKYDPYGDYLFKNGLLNRDNTTRYITEYINIDSSNRNKFPLNKIESEIEMENSLSLNTNSNILKINLPNHKFLKNDKITLTGIVNRQSKINVKINNIKKIDFTNGSQYMTIYDDVGVTFQNVNTANNYDSSNMFINISGVKGFPGSTYIENIPISTINGLQRVYLVNPETGIYNTDRYYIKLVSKFSGAYNPSEYIITLVYLYTGGIPNNMINANFPVNFSQMQGFHVISNTDKNNIYIELNKSSANDILNFGGGNIYIAKIKDTIDGYTNPNSYSMKLEKSLADIVSARLVSSEFPNTEKVIRSSPEAKKNNKLYWENLDEGTVIYSIEIPDGNYNASELSTVIQNEVLKVKKVTENITNTTNYTDNNYIRVSIDTSTDIVTFKSYKEALLVKPFISVSPQIDLKATETVTSLFYDITVQQLNHGVSVGDEILISGAIAYYGIPASILNNQYIITEVIDKDRYKFRVQHFNLDSQRNDTGGGSAVVIFVPNIFRLRFDFPDTIGNILGFRNSGDENSITNYGTVITNKDSYTFEQPVNSSGDLVTIKNNSINLAGDNYILMVCKQLKGIFNQGKVKDAFAKIQLSGTPGRVLFNSFIPAQIYYHDPIVEITSLDFDFYSPDGTLYDFNGLDHSFMIELVSLSEIPKGTGISTSTGKIN